MPRSSIQKSPSRLSVEMKQRKLSAVKMAKEIGMSPWTIHNAIHRQQSKETRDKIAKFLSLPPDDLGPVNMQSKPYKRKKLGEFDRKPFMKVKETLAPAPLVGAVSEVAASGVTLPAKPSADALVTALFKTRKEKGYKTSEVAAINNWAAKIVQNANLLRSVLEGKATVDIDDKGEIKVDAGNHEK